MSGGTDRGVGVVLIGYRGTGKTTVGRLLADRLAMAQLDLDAAIESSLGQPIAVVFAEQGEHAFRDAESRLIAELAADSEATPRVVSTGGGAILRAENRVNLRKLGPMIWLTADPSTIAARLGDDPAGRPALTEFGLIDEVAHVLKVREPLYQEASDVQVETTGQTPDEVAERIFQLLMAGTVHRGRR